MIEEQFETYSEAKELRDLVARSEVHRQGLWHRACNVFLFRSNGSLVIQRRHPDKDVYPDSWDLSVAEHLQPGESYLDAAIRGLDEELGISGVALMSLGLEVSARLDIPKLGIKDYEFQMSFYGYSDSEIILQAEEVAEVRLFELDDLEVAMLNSPDSFTPWFRDAAQNLGLFEGMIHQ